MDNEISFSFMQSFVAVARAESFTKAGLVLGLPKSTLSRQIADLERALGVRLLNRTTRHVTLTEIGVSYLSYAARIIEQAHLFNEEFRAKAGSPSGTLRVSMTEPLAAHVAIPWIAEFARLFPNIDLDLDTSPQHVNPIVDGFDICIVDYGAKDSSLTIRRLVAFDRSLFASPAYAASHGLPSHPDELANHRCICLGARTSRAKEWTLTRGTERVSVGVSGRVSAVNLDFGWALAREGMGIAPAVTKSFEADVADGSLVPVLPDWQFEPLILSAIFPSRPIPIKTRVFIDFFIEKIRFFARELNGRTYRASSHSYDPKTSSLD